MEKKLINLIASRTPYTHKHTDRNVLIELLRTTSGVSNVKADHNKIRFSIAEKDKSAIDEMLKHQGWITQPE